MLCLCIGWLGPPLLTKIGRPIEAKCSLKRSQAMARSSSSTAGQSLADWLTATAACRPADGGGSAAGRLLPRPAPAGILMMLLLLLWRRRGTAADDRRVRSSASTKAWSRCSCCCHGSSTPSPSPPPPASPAGSVGWFSVSATEREREATTVMSRVRRCARRTVRLVLLRWPCGGAAAACAVVPTPPE